MCSKEKTYNRQQNELRHFALNWASYVLLTSKGGKIAFPPPSSPRNVVLMFKPSTENKKHPNFEWRGQGRGADSFVLLIEFSTFTHNLLFFLLLFQKRKKITQKSWANLANGPYFVSKKLKKSILQ